MHRPPGSQIEFKPCGDVHAVAENIVAVNNDVADIDADAEDDAFLVRNGSVSFDHLALDGHGAGDRVDDAGKIHQQPVAGGFDDASAIGGDRGIQMVFADSLERAQSSDFVGPHQATVADDVRG